MDSILRGFVKMETEVELVNCQATAGLAGALGLGWASFAVSFASNRFVIEDVNGIR